MVNNQLHSYNPSPVYHNPSLFIKLILIIVMFSFVVGASASTRYVNETGWWLDTFNASSVPISAAISNSSAFDSVYVYNGTYPEAITVSINNFTFTGEGRDVVNMAINDADASIMTVTGNDVNVSGFNFSGLTFGVSISGSRSNFSFNGFYNIYGEITLPFPPFSKIPQDGYGLKLTGTSGTYNDNVFYNCSGGIYVGGSYNTITNNTITKSTKTIYEKFGTSSPYYRHYGGIVVLSDNNVFTNNIISESYGLHGVSLGYFYYGAELPAGKNNIFTDGSIDKYSINVECCALTTSYNNTFIDTNFSIGSNRTILYRVLSYDYGIFGGINTTNNDIMIHSYPYASNSDSYSRSNYREILNLSQSNVSYIETPKTLDSGITEWKYKIGGLYPLTSYTLYRNNVNISVLTTDSSGTLPIFGSGGISTTLISIIYEFPTPTPTPTPTTTENPLGEDFTNFTQLQVNIILLILALFMQPPLIYFLVIMILIAIVNASKRMVKQ